METQEKPLEGIFFTVLIVPCGMETIWLNINTSRNHSINCTLWNGNVDIPDSDWNQKGINCTLWNGNLENLNAHLLHFLY